MVLPDRIPIQPVIAPIINPTNSSAAPWLKLVPKIFDNMRLSPHCVIYQELRMMKLTVLLWRQKVCSTISLQQKPLPQIGNLSKEIVP